MGKLGKSTLSLTFKFDSDRFLRFRLASAAEAARIGLEENVYTRPGIELITAAGRRWEIDKYEDLLDAANPEMVRFNRGTVAEVLVEKLPFKAVQDLLDVLRAPLPPVAVIEPEFEVPDDITPSLRRAYEEFGLETVRARPDILWIRRASTGSPLIRRPGAPPPEFEIHIIDVKMAAEPSLRHFTEVTFYALALARLLENEGIADRFAVSAVGLIWPGSHDANHFRSLVTSARASGTVDPLTTAFAATLIPVPYEVYQVHVKQFFESRLLRVLAQPIESVQYHVSPNCQFCDYLGFCTTEAERTGHLSRVAWLTRGQADSLREQGIATVAALAAAIRENSPSWQSATRVNSQLRAEGQILLARAAALNEGRPVVIEDRKVASMPRYADMRIYLTVHFDLGSGITFGMGAKRVYFAPDRPTGSPPVVSAKTFVVDRVEQLSPDTERARLLEFARSIAEWMDEADRFNAALRQSRVSSGTRDSEVGKVRVHFYMWDALEGRQLRRMLGRHMGHPDVIDVVERLVRMFPPEDVLPDPEMFKSQPGTVVKDVVRVLVGLPIPHDYTLLEVANAFHPRTRAETGEIIPFRLAFGFVTEMSDQIPFERAYELWSDRVALRHYDATREPHEWIRQTRGDIQHGLEHAMEVRLDALEHVVTQLQRHCGAQLTLRKGAFSSAPPSQLRLPESARQLNVFEQLDVACHEIDNRAVRGLPIDEREARFHSMRDLRVIQGDGVDARVADIRAAHPQWVNAQLIVCEFSPLSRDARVRERDFAFALSNEVPPIAAGTDGGDLDASWRSVLGLDIATAQARVQAAGLPRWAAFVSLASLFGVTIVQLDATQSTPVVVLSPGRSDLFAFGQSLGLLDLDRPMVLDPYYRDWESKYVTEVLKAVGGNAPSSRRRRT